MEKKKRKFKLPDSFTILFLIIIIVAILTWIVPSGEYVNVCDNGQELLTDSEGVSYCPVDEASADIIAADLGRGEIPDETLYTTESTPEYQELDEKNVQGFWQIANAPVNGFYDAIDIALFVIVIGGFINVVIKTGALDAGIGALLRKFNGKEIILIPILMILFGLGGTTYGMSEETIGFYLLVIPVFLAAGYDTITGVRVILLGAGVGVLASTVNPFAIGAAVEASGLDIGIGDGIINRTIFFVIVEAIAIFTTMRYAKKVKADISKSDVADLHEQNKKDLLNQEAMDTVELNGARKSVLWIFAIAFILMVMAVIPWEDFGISLFDTLTEQVDKFKAFSGISGVVPFGLWWFGELTTLFLMGAIIVGIIAAKAKLYTGTFIDVFLEGCKDLLAVALIIALARGITVIMQSSGIDATLLYYGSQALENLGTGAFVIGTYIFFIPLSFLIPSTSGFAAAVMPVMEPLANFVGGDTAAIYTITSFSAASGIVNLVTPTSGVVVGGLALARVPYDRWVRHVWKFLVLMFIVSIIFLLVGTLTNFIA